MWDVGFNLTSHPRLGKARYVGSWLLQGVKRCGMWDFGFAYFGFAYFGFAYFG
jgi:hypothetical protein